MPGFGTPLLCGKPRGCLYISTCTPDKLANIYRALSAGPDYLPPLDRYSINYLAKWRQPLPDFANARSLLFTAIYGLTIFSLKKDRCASSTGASLWQETHFSTSPALPGEALKNPSPFFNTSSFWIFGIGNLSVAGCGVTRFTMLGRITAMPPFLHSPYR